MKKSKASSNYYYLLCLPILVIILLLSLLIATSCQEVTADDNNELSTFLSYEIINIFPHDPAAFTQGLVWEDSFLYEGTGLYGSSSLRKVDLKTGKILQYHNLAADYFGEGITIFNNKIYQLTWQEEIGFIYEKETLQLLGTFSYPYEGWGITHDGMNLIISDGSSTLHFVDPLTMEEVRQLNVHFKETCVLNLNELEYIKGKVYANIWQTTLIAIIDPITGEVVNWLDLKDIFISVKKDSTQKIDVLNGIAYDERQDYLLVTGKLWPKLFEIKIHNSLII